MQPKNNGSQAIERVVVPEIVTQQQTHVADIDVLAVVERRNQIVSKLLNYAISATHSGQWFDQNGKPYPGAAAAEVMARRCAVRVENVRFRKQQSADDKGQFYVYIVEATASLPGNWDSIEAMGTCSSRDTFLGTETRSGRALSEVDEGNILKAAYSNMLVNAVTRLLGVRQMTWEQLAQLGITREGTTRVEYKHGSKGGGAPEHAATGGEMTVPFGKSKGTPISQADDATLSWLLKVTNESIADPAKEKYKASNQKLKAACEAELRRRSGHNDEPPPGEAVSATRNAA